MTYSFKGDSKDQLSVEPGDLVTVRRSADGWYLGYVTRPGGKRTKEGLIPISHVELNKKTTELVSELASHQRCATAPPDISPHNAQNLDVLDDDDDDGSMLEDTSNDEDDAGLRVEREDPELVKLASENSQLKSLLEKRVKVHAAQIQKLISTKRRLKSERRKIERSLRAEIARKEKDLDVLSATNKELETQVSQLDENKEIQTLTALVVRLREQAGNAQDAMIRMQENVAPNEEARKKAEARADALEAQVRERDEAIQGLEAKLKEATELAAKTAKDHAEELQSHSTKLAADSHATLETAQSEAKQELEKVRAEAQQEIEKARAEVTSARAESKQATETMRAELEAREKTIVALKSNVKGRDERLQSDEKRIAELEDLLARRPFAPTLDRRSFSALSVPELEGFLGSVAQKYRLSDAAVARVAAEELNGEMLLDLDDEGLRRVVGTEGGFRGLQAALEPFRESKSEGDEKGQELDEDGDGAPLLSCPPEKRQFSLEAARYQALLAEQQTMLAGQRAMLEEQRADRKARMRVDEAQRKANDASAKAARTQGEVNERLEAKVDRMIPLQRTQAELAGKIFLVSRVTSDRAEKLMRLDGIESRLNDSLDHGFGGVRSQLGGVRSQLDALSKQTDALSLSSKPKAEDEEGDAKTVREDVLAPIMEKLQSRVVEIREQISGVSEEQHRASESFTKQLAQLATPASVRTALREQSEELNELRAGAEARRDGKLDAIATRSQTQATKRQEALEERFATALESMGSKLGVEVKTVSGEVKAATGAVKEVAGQVNEVSSKVAGVETKVTGLGQLVTRSVDSIDPEEQLVALRGLVTKSHAATTEAVGEIVSSATKRLLGGVTADGKASRESAAKAASERHRELTQRLGEFMPALRSQMENLTRFITTNVTETLDRSVAELENKTSRAVQKAMNMAKEAKQHAEARPPSPRTVLARQQLQQHTAIRAGGDNIPSIATPDGVDEVDDDETVDGGSDDEEAVLAKLRARRGDAQPTQSAASKPAEAKAKAQASVQDGLPQKMEEWGVEKVTRFVASISDGARWKEYAEGMERQGWTGKTLLKAIDPAQGVARGLSQEDAEVLSKTIRERHDKEALGLFMKSPRKRFALTSGMRAMIRSPVSSESTSFAV